MIEKYENTKKLILEALNTKDVSDIFSGESHKLLSIVVSDIFRDIDKSISSEFSESVVDKDSLLKLIDIMEKVAILKPFGHSIHTFMSNIVETIFNWNRNILNDENIIFRLTIIQRALESKFTMQETINILKSLTIFIDSQIKDRRPTLTDGLSLEYIKLLGLE